MTLIDINKDRHCPYCNKTLDNMSVIDDWYNYWRCNNCKVSHEEIIYAPNHFVSKSSSMYCEIKGKIYCLHQFYNYNFSRIELIPKNLNDTIIIVAEFNFLFPNVTPQNISQKLSTYILFS
jgi:ribosomal protein L37AE/L43A